MPDMPEGPVKQARPAAAVALFDDVPAAGPVVAPADGLEAAVAIVEPVAAVVQAPAAVLSLPDAIDGLVMRIQMDIDGHREMEDVFRNRKWDEARQHLERASKLLRGE